MTVAHVIARLNVGGAAVHVISAVEGLRDEGYRTLLLVGQLPPGESSMEYLAKTRGLEITRIECMSRRISWVDDLHALLQLLGIFRRERPMVVHTHTAKAGTLGRIASILAGVPVRVHTFHGHVFEGYFSPMATKVFVAIERMLARFTDAILTVTESQREEIAYKYRIAPLEKIVAIPHGVDLKQFLGIEGRSGVLRKQLSASAEETIVGWIGRLTGIKAPEAFIAAAASLPTSLGLRFALIGDGELREACEGQLSRAGLEGRLSITGWLKDLHDIYADLDMIVLTSLNEGSPITLLEAMASGKPFIATDVGGVRDMMSGTPTHQDGLEIFENGILVGNDAGAVARAIELLAENPELRASMGASGRSLASSRYSMHRLTENLDRLYTQLATSKGQLTIPVPSV